MSNTGDTTIRPAEFFKFLIPSLCGLLLFILPMPYQGTFNLSMAVISDFLESAFEAQLPTFITIIICVSAGITLYTTMAKPKWVEQSDFVKKTFKVSKVWLFFRVIGALFAVMCLLKLGPEFIWNADTGGLMLVLLKTLTFYFFVAGFLLPLLTDFGLMEFLGTLARPAMEPLFRVPGRAAVDCIASFVGSAPIGALLTNNQYVDGCYTAREAANVVMCFSVSSLPFAIVIARTVDIMPYFYQWYGTIILATIILAIILPRIYPLKNKPNTYYNNEPSEFVNDKVPDGMNLAKFALVQAMNRAKKVESFGSVIKNGTEAVLGIWFGLEPLVMAWGTIVLILAEYTSFFNIIGYPFGYVLSWLQIPYAFEAAPATLSTFADTFIPNILVANIPSEMTRFVISCLSYCQVIYMTELGAYILGSELPLDLKDLIMVFMLRTIIALPLIAAVAHLVF